MIDTENFLKKRAEGFFDNALDLMNKNQFDLAAFNFEQAAQLFLKHYLFTQTQDFPRIHSLEALLQEVAKIHTHPRDVETFRKDNIVALTDLGEAYLTSRYIPTEFPREKVEIMQAVVKKLKNLLFA